MARRVKWTESAWQEVECGASYIRRDSPKYAAGLVAEVKAASRLLRQFPTRGRVVPEIASTEIREIFVREYRLIYRFADSGVLIIAFIHGARRFPTYLNQ